MAEVYNQYYDAENEKMIVAKEGETMGQSESNDEKYTLTPWGCLSAVLDDYGIDVSHISGRTGTHIVEDFMEDMARCGYVEKVTGDGTGPAVPV